MYQPDNAMVNPVKQGGLSSEHAAAAVVIGSLVFLIMIRKGFTGVSVGKISGGLVRG
jgi:hypothetical protein